VQDNRMKLMNEVLSGIRVIKMYAWEKPFDGFLEAARSKELKTLMRMQYISAGIPPPARPPPPPPA
jgi:hypothetical protein